jgi:hypothetical protein
VELQRIYAGPTMYAEMLAGDLRDLGIEVIVRPADTGHVPGLPVMVSEVLVSDPQYQGHREEIDECLAVIPGGDD